MGISVIGGSAAVSGAAGPVVPTIVSSTNGTFDLDLSTNTAFEIDFTESYFDTVNTQIGPMPIFVGENSGIVANGGSQNNANMFGGLSGGTGETEPQVGDMILLQAATGGYVNGSTAQTWPSITDDAGFTWTELIASAVDGGSSYDVAYRVWYAFYDGTQTVPPTINHGGDSTFSGVAMVSVFRGVDSTTPFGTVPSPNMNGGTSNNVDWNSLSIARDNSKVISLAFLGGSFGSNTPSVYHSWDYFSSRSSNDSYDVNIQLGIYDIQYDNGDTAAAISGGTAMSSTQSWATYQLQMNAANVPSGVGPTATISVSNVPSGTQSFTLYAKNTNSTGQSYPVTNGTNVASGAILESKSSGAVSTHPFTTYDGTVIAGGATAGPPKARKYERITATSTFTLPSDVSGLKITAVGGGGGGGMYTSTYGGGAGGGAGQYLEYECPVGTAGPGSVAAGATLNITIGAGGAAGTVNNRFAGYGGNTSIIADGHTVCIAYGGQGGNTSYSFGQGDWSRTDLFGSGGGEYGSYVAGGGGGASGPAHGEDTHAYTASGTVSVPSGGGGMWAVYGHGGGRGNTYSNNAPGAHHGGPGKNGLAGGGGGSAGQNWSYYGGGWGSDGGGQGSHKYNSQESTPGAANTGGGGGGGNGGYAASPGGSGVVILEYWSAE